MTTNTKIKNKIMINENIKYLSNQSLTFNHLLNYQPINYIITIILNVTLFNNLLSSYLKLITYINNTINSTNSPVFIKKIYSISTHSLSNLDHFINITLLNDGIDNLLKQFKQHNNTPGVWLLWFSIDYIANITNLLLHKLVILPKKNTTKIINSLDQTPHLTELKNITMDFVEPTKIIVEEKVEKVRDTYESNLNKTDSIPRAIVVTGMDLGGMTLEKFKSGKIKEQEEKQN